MMRKNTSETLRAALTFTAIFSLLFSHLGCGGGGGNGGGGEDGRRSETSHVDKLTLVARETGMSYGVSVATPLDYDESGAPYPAIFLLDGEWYFDWVRDSTYDGDGDDDVMIIGINNSDRRNTDYMPVNDCDRDGGGHSVFLKFIVADLLPYLDENYNIDPSLRLLVGHSHGGSFVLYTLFADGGVNFPLLLSIDASVGCALDYFEDLEQTYGSEHSELPVILYVAGATKANGPVVGSFTEEFIAKGYVRLAAVYEDISGTHDGIVSEAMDRGGAWISAQLE
jgi:hypothetical protein